MARKLPNWITVAPDGAFSVDPDLAYPKIIKLLGVNENSLDRYWLEVVFQCAKLAVDEMVTGTDLDPRPDRALVILIQGGKERKGRWALNSYKAGRGEIAATAARSRHEPSEAKRHFWKIARELCYGE